MAISKEQKAAMATGRTEARAVTTYLTSLNENKPKRGRKRTPDSIKKRLTDIEKALLDAPPIKVLGFIQEKSDLEAELQDLENKEVRKDTEDAFVKVAKEFGVRKGYSYQSWRSVGVPADVLKRAGIGR